MELLNKIVNTINLTEKNYVVLLNPVSQAAPVPPPPNTQATVRVA